MAGARMARLMAAFSASTIGCGTPAGAITPAQAGIAGYAGLGDGRQIGKSGRAMVAADRERAYRAGARKRRDGIEAFEHHLHAPGNEVVDRRRAALVGHMHVPVMNLNNSPPTLPGDPLLDDASGSLPGSCLA